LHETHPRLFFDKGTIRIDSADMLEIPDARRDERSGGGSLRAYAMHYARIIEYLRESEINYTDCVQNFIPIAPLKTTGLELRGYQQEAITKWKNVSMRGCVVLPTGAGKTAVGMHAIVEASAPALVIVPTIDLMEQWAQALTDHLATQHSRQKIPAIGRLGGGEDDLRAVTVATYDSAYIRAPEMGDRFGLVIFDEVHHLPAPGYRSIAEQMIAPYRLGLTATIEREDGLHGMLQGLVGGVVFRKGSQDLASQKYLASHTIRQIQVSLTPEEQKAYDQYRSEFLSGMKSLKMVSESMYNLKRLIMMSNRSRKARETLLARNRANETALNSTAKIKALKEILAGCSTSQRKTIIFTQNNKMAYVIADKFLIPIITHKTSKDERREILSGFKSNRYTAVVTSRVLDEGVDVPDAELGIIVSGTGSGREMIQRLGRLLRPKQDGGKAELVEIVSAKTRETGTSAKRGAALKKSASGRSRRRRSSDASK